MRSPSRVLALSLAVALVAAACGSSSPEAGSSTSARPSEPDSSETSDTSSSETSSSDTSSSDGPAVSENEFPDIDVAVVGSGDTVNLKEELAGGDTPVLLWFWAPH